EYIVAATLWSLDPNDEPFQELPNHLVGNTIAESRVLENLQGLLDIFFVFPHLYIRKEGRYRLCFRLIKIFSPSRDSLIPTSSVIGTVFSNIVQVFLPKHFPGKSKPSLLMRMLVKQTNDLKSRNL
ncbi:velvet factor, partial [Globomyces pollinis-pini]